MMYVESSIKVWRRKHAFSVKYRENSMSDCKKNTEGTNHSDIV